MGDESDGAGHQGRSVCHHGRQTGTGDWAVWEIIRGHVTFERCLKAESESTWLGMVFQGERQVSTEAWRTPSIWGKGDV